MKPMPSARRAAPIVFAFGRGRIAVGAGQTVRFLGGSRLTKNADNASLTRMRAGSGIFGAGAVDVLDVGFDLQSSSPDAYLDVGAFRVLTGWGLFDKGNNVTRFATRFNTVPSIPIEILSGRCPTNLNAQTTFNNYWNTGVSNAWLSPSVLLSGCNYSFLQNGDYAPHGDFYDATNIADKVTIRGHVGVYGPVSYGPDSGHTDSDGVQRGRVGATSGHETAHSTSRALRVRRPGGGGPVGLRSGRGDPLARRRRPAERHRDGAMMLVK